MTRAQCDPRPADLLPGLPAARFPAYRPGQYQLIEQLAEAGEASSILCAPTGTGKSLAYMSLGAMTGRTLVLTGTKGLQTQLLGDFADAGLVDIRGHANYSCMQRGARYRSRGGEDGAAAAGVRGQAQEYCAAGAACEYRRQVTRARNARLVSGNYAYWMALARYSDPTILGRFDLIVCDEGHTVPDWLSSVAAVDVREAEVARLLGRTVPDAGTMDAATWAAWGRETAAWARHVYREERDRLVASGMSRHEAAGELVDLAALGRELAELGRSSESQVRWVVEDTYATWRRRQKTGIRATPVWGREYARELLYRDAGRVVVVSATVTRQSAGYLGWRDGEYGYHEAGDGFDPRRRPLYYVPTAYVDWKMKEGHKRLLAGRMDRWIEARLDRKGIVHPRSYRRAREVVDRSTWAGCMVTHDDSRGLPAALERYTRGDAPGILVSPSVEEGFDGRGDLCRWQVIMKVPFVDSRDPVTRARLDDDKEYRNYCAMVSLMQQVGRGVRAADDWCETVIFDEHFGWWSGKVQWPAYFERAIVRVRRGTMPEPMDVTRLGGQEW